MIYYLTSCVGATLILKYGTILDSIKQKIPNRFQELLKCSLCTGFWVGIILAVTLKKERSGVKIFCLACASAGVCWIVDSILSLTQNTDSFIDKIQKDL